MKSQINIKIVGKTTCPYCVRAIDLCKSYNIEPEWVDCLQYPEIRQQYSEKYDIKTVPIILINNEFIGGFSEFSPYLQKIMQNQANPPVQMYSKSKEETKLQYQQVQQITNKNLDLFSIKMTEKEQQQQKETKNKDKDKEYGDFNDWYNLTIKNYQIEKENESYFAPRLTTHFGDGSYVHYYDTGSKGQQQQYKYSLPLVIICGYPAFKFEWRRLQMELGEDCCRVIHFCIPGLDHDKTIRGEHCIGDLQSSSLLLKKLLDHLKIPKIMLACHSFGTYLQGDFEKSYPQYVVSSLMLGAIGVHPHIRAKLWYDNILYTLGTTHQELPEKYEKIKKELKYNEKKDFEKIELDQVENPTDGNANIAFEKIMVDTSAGIEGIFETLREPKNILKLIGSGAQDFIIESQVSCELIQHYAQGPGNAKIKLSNYQKEQFIAKIQQNQLLRNNLNLQNFNFENLQQNFLFLFDKTGHSVHRRRGQELKIPILVFMELSQVLLQSEEPKL